MKFALLAISLLISTPCEAEDTGSGIQAIRPFLDRISSGTVRESWNFPSETTAMKYFAAICVRNRKSAARTRKALKANGYALVANDNSDGVEYWHAKSEKPLFVLEQSGSKLERCATFVGKAARNLGDLESLLDSLITEDIQRVPESAVNFRRGERGWVLRPGFEHAVYLLALSAPNSTAITLSRLN